MVLVALEAISRFKWTDGFIEDVNSAVSASSEQSIDGGRSAAYDGLTKGILWTIRGAKMSQISYGLGREAHTSRPVLNFIIFNDSG